MRQAPSFLRPAAVSAATFFFLWFAGSIPAGAQESTGSTQPPAPDTSSWVFSSEYKQPVDVLAYFPLYAGATWVYEETCKSAVGNAGDIGTVTWLRESTITGFKETPQGRVVLMRVTDSNVSYDIPRRAEQESQWLRQNYPDQQEGNLFISGNSVYWMPAWASDANTGTIAPEYARRLAAGEVSPDFCFPMDKVRFWAERTREERLIREREAFERGQGPAPDIGMYHWSTEGRASIETPAGTLDDCRLVVQYALGGAVRRYFRDGIGLVAEYYSHAGTFEERETRLVRFSPGEGAERDRTGWFHAAKWGVFTHYMADTVLRGQEITIERWNEAVDSFDVDALAEALAAMHASYYVITLGQNSGYYCSPNAVYDRLTGIDPSKCSRRDLVAGLYAALKPRGIRLMVYLPSGAPDRDPAAMQALEWAPGKYPIWSHPDGGPDGGDARFTEFQNKWESVIREWSARWGGNVSGWWFDGCYYPHGMYFHPDPPNFASLAGAARAGNPDGIVAFNPGVFTPVRSLTPYEDYTAGEINEPDRVVCTGRRLGSAQFHILSYLGPSWAQSPPRFTDEQVIALTRNVTGKGGVVTWDVPINADGSIPEPFADQLRALGAAMEN